MQDFRGDCHIHRIQRSARTGGALCCLLAFAARCESPKQDSGGIKIQAATKALHYSDISTVTATLTGPGIAHPYAIPMGPRGTSWQANVVGLPAGTGRMISVLARDHSGTGIFSGQAASITISPGQTATVSIVLFEISPAPTFANTAPTIDALELSTTQAVLGGTVTAGVHAHDPDAGDTLTFAWTASCGTFSDTTAAQTIWTAPQSAGPCDVMITVADGHGASVNADATLTVMPSARGGVAVIASPDLSPVIQSITCTPTPLVAGRPVTLNVNAVDPDGQLLTYAWSTNCAGTFDHAIVQNPTFALSANPSTKTCRFSVEVTDSQGAKTIGILNQATGAAAVDEAPVITVASQSQEGLAPGQSASLSVQASDPDGQALAFAWSASDGTVDPVSSDAQSASVRFTAPAVLPQGTMHVTVVVTDTGGLSTSLVFNFNRLNHPPTISDTAISPVPLLIGQGARLSATATDSDGDSLGYTWTSTCVGTFDNTASATPIFTLTSFPASLYCSFTVVVSDGFGGQAVTTALGMVDHLPVISATTLSPLEIILGQPTMLAAMVTDSDGDALTYSWSRSCQGSFDDATSRTPKFTLSAIPVSGRCSFTVTVTDARGGQAMASVTGQVGSAPEITDMQVVPLPLLAGHPCQLSVAATDADSDLLTFAWATDCTGTFANESSAAPTFTLAAVPANHLCIFQVRVSDGRGGESLGQVSGQAGAIVVDLAPVIDGFSQGQDVVSSGDHVPLSVSASDPEGLPVNYNWSATDGTFSGLTTAPDTSSSSVFWTPPASMPSQPMHVTVIVSDPSGLQTSVTFDFTAAIP
jgi:hypothetical protein